MPWEKKNGEEKAVVKWLGDKGCAMFHSCRNFFGKWS